VDDISTNTNLTDAERIDRLRLIRSDNVGPRGIMAQTPQAVYRTVLMSILTDRDLEFLASLKTRWRRYYFDEVARLRSEDDDDAVRNDTFKASYQHPYPASR
jgi:hypothetical protein